MRNLVATFLLASAFSTSAFAQSVSTSAPTQDVAIQAPQSQEYCINVMARFPKLKLGENQSARYQFFKLTQSLAKDATPEFRKAMAKYASGNVTEAMPVTDVIEGIANPVLRQAEPSLIIGFSAYLIEFANICSTSISGQISSLQAYDPELTATAFNTVIDEDALYLRQILSDAMHAQKSHQDPQHAHAVLSYAVSLVSTRDKIEFKSFNSEIDDLESLYMGDLDKRLAHSNDAANGDMNREALSSSVALSDDLNNNIKRQEQQRTLQTLIHILNGY